MFNLCLSVSCQELPEHWDEMNSATKKHQITIVSKSVLYLHCNKQTNKPIQYALNVPHNRNIICYYRYIVEWGRTCEIGKKKS